MSSREIDQRMRDPFMDERREFLRDAQKNEDNKRRAIEKYNNIVRNIRKGPAPERVKQERELQEICASLDMQRSLTLYDQEKDRLKNIKSRATSQGATGFDYAGY